MSDVLDARPVKLTDGTWAVMVAGKPYSGQPITVTTLEGKRWRATVTELGETDPVSGEVLCHTHRGPSLPDATPEQLAERMARAEAWMLGHKMAEARRRERRKALLRVGWSIVGVLAVVWILGTVCG